jgi:hypothetical protein
MEGLIKVCRDGEWVATGTPCEQATRESFDADQIKSYVASEGKIREVKKEQSMATFAVRDCLPNTESGTFETKTGEIDVHGSASPTYPPYAKYIATDLAAVDGSAKYSFVQGFQKIKPGRYNHTVRGEIQTWGDCKNKLFQIISIVTY